MNSINLVMKQTATKRNRTLLILLILVSGDIQLNPGPGNGSVFPCGCCELPVTWSQLGVCCTNCSTGQPRYLKVQGNGENTSSYPKFDIAKM